MIVRRSAGASRPRRRVLQVIEAVGSGTGKHVRSILEHLDRDRFEVEVASPAARHGTHDGADFVPAVRAMGVPWHCVPMERAIDMRRDGVAFLDLVRIIRRGRFDVVHTHSSKAGFLGRAAARLSGIPSLYTPNGLYFLRFAPGPRRTIYAMLERLAASWGDRIIAVSEGERQAATDARLAPPRRVVTTENGVDDVVPAALGAGQSLRAKLGIADDAYVVGTVARFSVQKDPATLIRAVQTLGAQVDRPVHLVWCGDGELRGEMEQLSDRLGIREVVHFLGVRSDVYAVMQLFDVFALASRYEGLPYALLEAMAAGVPVVVTDVVGNRDVVAHEATGLLVPAEAPDALAAALGRVLANPQLEGELTKRARSLIETRFSAAAMVRRLEALYDEVAAGR